MNIIIIMALTLGLSATAFAKKGGSDPIKLAFKNSQAGFISESLEQSMMDYTSANPEQKDAVLDASVVTKTPDEAVVTISLADGSAVSFVCQKIDDLSNGGTVLKKEAVCAQQL